MFVFIYNFSFDPEYYYKNRFTIKVMKRLTISFLVLATLIGLLKADNYTLVLLSQDSGAACLDGSPVGIYINEGKG